jgi:hypothetical protein
MLTWLVDNATLLYMLLGIVGILCAVVWWRTRQRPYAIAVGVVLLLVIVVGTLSHFVQTDSMRIEGVVKDMAAGVQAHDLDRVFRHVSDRFTFRGNDKAAFHKKCQGIMDVRNVTAIEVWEFEPREISRERKTARMEFRVKPRGNWEGGYAFYRCVADFVLDADGQWRLQTFEVLNPYINERMEIPGF